MKFTSGPKASVGVMMMPMIVGKGVMVETAVGGFVAVGPVAVGDAVDVGAGDAVGGGSEVAVLLAAIAGMLVAGCVGGPVGVDCDE